MFQSYAMEDFGPEVNCSIPKRVQKLKDGGVKPQDILSTMRSEGYEVVVDSSGGANFFRENKKEEGKSEEPNFGIRSESCYIPAFLPVASAI